MDSLSSLDSAVAKVMEDSAFMASGSWNMAPPAAPAISGGTIAAIGLTYVLFIAFAIVVGWKIFTKAGKPGWAVLVPIYNVIVMLEIVKRPLWWIVLFFIPLVNIVIAFILVFDMARKFGKGTGFGLGMAFLGFIFYPILAFGEAKYDANA